MHIHCKVNKTLLFPCYKINKNCSKGADNGKKSLVLLNFVQKVGKAHPTSLPMPDVPFLLRAWQ